MSAAHHHKPLPYDLTPADIPEDKLIAAMVRLEPLCAFASREGSLGPRAVTTLAIAYLQGLADAATVDACDWADVRARAAAACQVLGQ